MRILQAIGVLVALGAGVFLVGGQFLPGRMEISRSGELCHTPYEIFQALNTPDRIAEWALFSREAELPVTYSEDSGPGGWVLWTGKDADDTTKEDTIEWKIRETRPPEYVEYVIALEDSITVETTARIEALDTSHSRLRMTLILEPDSIPGRWGMVLAYWLPGDDDFRSLLDGEIEGIQTHLTETADACNEASPV